ncbi:MAG TPA: Sec-independent protein translocase protein TatB [Euzebyales bacterium]
MDVGFMELMMLAVLALLIFGPERLPQIARTVGRVVGQIKHEASATFSTLRDEVELDELRSISSDLRRERDDLRARSRIDARSVHDRSRRSRATDDFEADEPPRYDPHAT